MGDDEPRGEFILPNMCLDTALGRRAADYDGLLSRWLLHGFSVRKFNEICPAEWLPH